MFAPSHSPSRFAFVVITGALAIATACTPGPSPGANGTGGAQTPGSGGTAPATGGAAATGGAGPANSGGSNGSGGRSDGSGGATPGTGGAPAATGGASTGGADASGGATPGTGGRGGAEGGRGGAAPATGGSAGGTGSGGAAGGSGNAPVRSAGCGKTRTLKDGHLTINSNGTNRTYYLNTPANYDNMHPYRLVFAFHWNGGSGNSIVNPPDADHNIDRPYYGFLDLSGDTTIFVAPDGIGAGWANTQNRDVIFTDDMLKQISDDLCIDTSRVFTTGFSWGGAMSWKLACVRTDKFRAAVVYDAGAVSGNSNAECTKPIAWFQSHGFDDQTFKYQGVALPLMSLFAKLNGCTAMTPADPPTNGHACVSFQNCMPATPVRFCAFGKGENNTHPPGGHYPSPKDPGQTMSWVPDEAWKFITQF